MTTTGPEISTPSTAKARVHWVGPYAEQRHPADVYAEIVAGTPDLVIVDARHPETFAREHLPGAVSLPWKQLDAEMAATLRRDVRYVVYCWSETCHASAKAAARMASFGFDVKEMHGGLQAWKRQGFPTERD